MTGSTGSPAAMLGARHHDRRMDLGRRFAAEKGAGGVTLAGQPLAALRSLSYLGYHLTHRWRGHDIRHVLKMRFQFIRTIAGTSGAKKVSM